MRGKLYFFISSGSARRITPADAGKTFAHKGPHPVKRDHPRGCGENLPSAVMSDAAKGSPPRMRGKRRLRPAGHARCRITPADAGKTHIRGAQQEIKQDHPRGCGENFYLFHFDFLRIGSPPRMRGKLLNKRQCVINIRITPADAGKTRRGLTLTARLRDHPRGCGENADEILLCACGKGSPPRMRGKRNLTRDLLAAPGITPADAGKTITHVRCSGPPPDHPRGCGENFVKDFTFVSDCGSPPRMRGKLHHVRQVDFPRRITPADAGKTRRCQRGISIYKDHPRGCGENRDGPAEICLNIGSPPRMRGKLELVLK